MIVEGDWDEELRGLMGGLGEESRITELEIRSALKRLKSGKAAGKAGILGELGKAGGM